MQTQLADFIRDTPEGREADTILRKCVHCGFCTATCPTYQLLGDELDGPRGRIYLIKQVLEGQEVTEKTRLHLDRCLTCRSCETTCPSGVQYHRLLDIGRGVVEARVPRPAGQRLLYRALRTVLPNRAAFEAVLKAGRLARPFLPVALAEKLRPPAPAKARPAPECHARRVILLEGCVQPGLAPNINAAAARVLDRVGIAIVREGEKKAGCCGALRYHLNDQDSGLDDMRANIDAWWPAVEAGAEAILVTASACSAQVKEYGHLLRHDPAYAERAARVSALARDVAEVVAGEEAAIAAALAKAHGGDAGSAAAAPARVAFHSPCTLQHGQKIRGVVERLLAAAGYALTPVADGHLCCGSAGTYSLTQPELSLQLRSNKLAALEAGNPGAIVTANIGCLNHLAAGTATPVRHWIELLDERLGEV
ncbi:glycolate oxidase subunit GlcF [Oryzomicrobium sp.]|uniref:glycolate oxidase subunit GlcF n=1 Tax=Oryzomicrobium sp. TaxID=1911578 RepID=UPI002FE16FDF